MFLLRKILFSFIVIITCFNNRFINSNNVDKNINPVVINLLEGFKSDYKGHLIIDKLGLNIGFYDKDNILNNVDYGLELLKTSIMPDNHNNYIILLASHSGDSNISYFKNLHELKQGDEVILDYNNQDYQFKVYKKYIIDKTGLFDVKVVPLNSLVLITCVKGTNKQLVIICK